MDQLRVRAIYKSYPGQPVLNGVDLDVESGTTMAILGPSGCGKTTMLRLIAGFDRPDGGGIWLRELQVSGDRIHMPPEARHIGYVPQEGALFPHLNVAANIGFGLPRVAQKVARIAEMLELVGMSGLEKRMPHELSGGQQQRVALARALAPAPALVLLDEPFSGLDASLRQTVRADVKRVLTALGATAVLVTHDQTEAFTLADRVAVMRGGRLVQNAEPTELYWRPIDLAVAQFVGEAVILPGEIHDAVARCALGTLPLRNAGAIGDGPATLLLRPEQVAWEPERNGAQGTAARVSEVTFLGRETQVAFVLTAPGAPRTVITSSMPGFEVPTIGDTVRLHVEDGVMAYPLSADGLWAD